MTQDIEIGSFFTYLNRHAVPYCVVGPTDKLPNDLESDLDIVMDVEPGVALRHIEMFCRLQDLRIVQHLQHEITAHYYVLWKKNRNDDRFVSIDICKDFLRDARSYLSSRELVSGRRQSAGDNNRSTFYIPRPEMAFAYYLIKRVDKMDLTAKQGHYLSQLWHQAPTAAREEIVRHFGHKAANAIEDAAKSRNWDQVSGNSTLRRALHWRASRISIKVWLAELLRICSRVRRPTGIHAVFLGADGSGKSSVIERVLAALEPVFRRRLQYHLFPVRNLTRSQGPVIDPHARPLRGTVPSSMQLVLWFLRYLVGWVREIWPARIKATVVLFDRYYQDVLVDPRRYRYGGPTWLARALGWLVPKPDLWILLDAPVEVLQARKQEVPIHESERQRRAYLALAKEFENGTVLDSSKPLEEVTREASRWIIEFMAKRTAQRLNLL